MKDEGVSLKRYRAGRVRPKFSRPEVLMTHAWVALWATWSMRVAIVIVTVTGLQTHISTSPCTQVSIPDTNHSSIEESLNWFIFSSFFFSCGPLGLTVRPHCPLKLECPDSARISLHKHVDWYKDPWSLSDTLRAR